MYCKFLSIRSIFSDVAGNLFLLLWLGLNFLGQIFCSLATTTILLIHAEGSIALVIMPFSSNSMIFFTSSRRATGMRRDECWTGRTLVSITIFAFRM